MYLLSSTGRMDGDNEYSRDDELWILWDPVSKKQGRDIRYLSRQLASTNVHMGKYTHTQAHKTTPTEQKENPWNGGKIWPTMYMMKNLYQKHVKIGKGS